MGRIDSESNESAFVGSLFGFVSRRRDSCAPFSPSRQPVVYNVLTWLDFSLHPSFGLQLTHHTEQLHFTIYSFNSHPIYYLNHVD
jgi:hypothetical protein